LYIKIPSFRPENLEKREKILPFCGGKPTKTDYIPRKAKCKGVIFEKVGEKGVLLAGFAENQE
jgi:hypothetical protein